MECEVKLEPPMDLAFEDVGEPDPFTAGPSRNRKRPFPQDNGDSSFRLPDVTSSSIEAMHFILRQWGLEALAKRFDEHLIDVNVLDYILDADIVELCRDFPIRYRLVLRRNINNKYYNMWSTVPTSQSKPRSKRSRQTIITFAKDPMETTQQYSEKENTGTQHSYEDVTPPTHFVSVEKQLHEDHYSDGTESGQEEEELNSDYTGPAYKVEPAGMTEMPQQDEETTQFVDLASHQPILNSQMNTATLADNQQTDGILDGIIPCSDLATKYASTDSDSLELHALLSSWNLSDLFLYFQQQHLYVGVLKHLTPEMAVSIIQQPCIPLGAQIAFNYNWNQWIKTVDVKKNSSQQKHIEVPTHELVSVQQLKPLTSVSSINLNTILKSNQYGTSLISAYNKSQKMDDNLRKILLESILQYCIEKQYDLSVKDAQFLAEQIVQVFPGEVMEYYFIERKHAAPLGKLYNKYRNWKSGLNKKSAGEQTANSQQKTNKPESSKLHRPTADEDSHIRALKHELSTLSDNEKMDHWIGCVATRLNQLKNDQSLETFFDTWPMYKSPDGYRMIEADFVYLFEQKNELLDNLDLFVDVMTEIFVTRKSSFKSTEDIELFKKLCEENSGSLAKNTSAAITFRLIQNLLPFSKVKSGEKKKFYSVEESRNAFLMICSSEVDYKIKFDAKVQRESSIPPYMSIIGTIDNIQYIMVNFDNISYKVFSLAKAIDICFKAYQLFNIEYPPQCESLYDFLNHEFYKLKYKSNRTKPPTFVLLNELKAAKLKRLVPV